jgi:hypothetical protein
MNLGQSIAAKEIGSVPLSTCDKCGEHVDPKNDALLITAHVDQNPFLLFVCRSRHLLPTDKCEGSPSRAQYLDGQPKDERGYTYDEERAREFREGYIEYQARLAVTVFSKGDTRGQTESVSHDLPVVV